MSIKESLNKIKGSFLSIKAETKYNAFIAILIVLVGTASFGLGRLSNTNTGSNGGGIRIFTPENMPAGVIYSGGEFKDSSATSKSVSQEVYVPDQGGEVVASKSGSKYHFPWCGGAKQIAEKNLITFASIEEARKAGYTPAANCKGLK